MAERAFAAQSRNHTPVSPVNRDVSIGPTGSSLDIRFQEYEFSFQINVDVPLAVAGDGSVPSVDPSFNFSFSPMVTKGPVLDFANVRTGVAFSAQEIQFSAAVAADHGNKFPLYVYGKALELVGNVMSGYGAIGIMGVPLPYATPIGQGDTLNEQAGKYLQPEEVVQ